MYTAYGFRDYEIGDVDVIKHDGIYHLFHLTLPNHDYIAHAVSKDGLHWRRVKNALFIGDPREWDDDMLWTMHITPNPYRPGRWRMFYTGLSMEERGRVQRVGLASSEDLYHWQKVFADCYPLEIPGDHYEDSLDQGREWVSFRDPFFFREGEDAYLLASARVNKGPVIRRGCVALARETAENQFEFCPPLFHPGRYDDLEVPNLVKLGDRYYLIASTREDIKVHYWYARNFEGPYKNFYDNVLLPQGNYAARVARDGERYLVWNFFFKGLTTAGFHLLAPPKELVVNHDNELRLRSFAGFDDLVSRTFQLSDLSPLQPVFGNADASGKVEGASCWLQTESGFEVFVLQGVFEDFILSGKLILEGSGKCGLVFRLDEVGDGYYVSLDLFKGIAQVRAWGHKEGGSREEAFYYEQLQAAHSVPVDGPHSFTLVVYEQYIEFSLNGYVLLTLADDHFHVGRVGFYVESVALRVEDLELKTCEEPPIASYPDLLPNY